jgi:hypothetical protein
MIFFDSLNPAHKNPPGAVRAGTEIAFRLKISRRLGVTFAALLWKKDGGEEESFPLVFGGWKTGFDLYEAKIKAPEAGLWFYAFLLKTARGQRYAGAGRGELPLWDAPCFFQQTVYEEKLLHAGSDQRRRDLSHLCGPFFRRGGKRQKKRDPIPRGQKRNAAFLPDENGKVLNNDFYGGNLQEFSKNSLTSSPWA